MTRIWFVSDEEGEYILDSAGFSRRRIDLTDDDLGDHAVNGELWSFETRDEAQAFCDGVRLESCGTKFYRPFSPSQESSR